MNVSPLVDAGAGVGRPDVGLVPHLPGVDAPQEVARQDDGRARGEGAQKLVVAAAGEVLGVVGRPVRLPPDQLSLESRPSTRRPRLRTSSTTRSYCCRAVRPLGPGVVQSA